MLSADAEPAAVTNNDGAASIGEITLSRYRRHLSKGRAALGEMFGAHIEESSHGIWLTTHDGRRFLNCGAYGTLITGATHPRIVDAVVSQVRKHPLSSRMLVDSVSALAAERIASVAPPGLEKVHFAGSGTEATEAALKLARAQGVERIVTTRNGYHGKTFGALSVTARAFYQDPFRPLLPGVVEVEYNDAPALGELLSDGVRSCFIVEPIQGEAGVITPAPGYLEAVRAICDQWGALLIVDEILTGLGRTGRWWGGGDVIPDIMLVGKGLSGGVVPVSAMVCKPKLFRPFDRDPFLHTSTFSGAPIAAAAAAAAIEVIRDEDLVGRARAIGDVLANRIGAVREAHPALITDLRGIGALLGVELRDAGITGELVLELMERDLLVSHSMNNSSVIRLTPPAVATATELDEVCDRFAAAMEAVANNVG